MLEQLSDHIVVTLVLMNPPDFGLPQSRRRWYFAEMATSHRASRWQRRIGSGSPSFRNISWERDRTASQSLTALQK